MKKRPPAVAGKSEPGKASRRKSSKDESMVAREDASEFCPVVGVGASAGGLEAFAQLLSHLPKATGLAFVLVQHLDPTRESHLSEILGRSSKMPVVEAESGMALSPDRIYVIPPNASASVADGTLALEARATGRERYLPIDHFFDSLAGQRGAKAIGVVLSGNASDGTTGLRAIKAAGGITFAQDENSAKFPGMPRSAAGAGCVDFVLPPEKIAAELVRLGQAPYLLGDGEKAPEANGLRIIYKLLRTATGIDFTTYRQTTIRRRIQRRLTVLRMDALPDYFEYLQKQPGEVQALFQDILIHVTNFFREPDSFEALAAQAFPPLLENRGADDPIRVWVPGCSTGEEAYSLAICLLEFLGDKAEGMPIQVFGTDVSEQVIEAARRGSFDAGIEADVSPDLLRRYFAKNEHGYQVNKRLRDLCVFARQNVIKDPPFSKLDLISCRNVLIYFEPDLQKKLLPIFHYALKPHGYLLLGSAETVGTFGDLFHTVEAKHRLFQKRVDGRHTLPQLHFAPEIPPRPEEPAEAAVHSPREVWSRLDVLKEADRVVNERFCPPGLVVNEAMEIIQFRGEVAPYLNPETGEASLNIFKMTHPLLGRDLRVAIAAARGEGVPDHRHPAEFVLGGKRREITLEVLRLDPPAVKERAFVILFHEASALPASPGKSKSSRREETRSAHLAEELAALKQHLQALSEEHDATNEELRSANEEIQSSNEELQSTNEELETAKEELQSTNEELITLNEELHHYNADLTAANDDLGNLLRGVALPVVMLGRDLRVRRFTPAAQRLFKFIAADVGREITDFKANIEVPDLELLVQEVIDGLCVKERELRDAQGRWHRLQARPYETADNKIAGAVLVFFDIDEAKRNHERLTHATDYAEAIIEMAAAPLIVLDGHLRVKRATATFCAQFRVAPEAVEGQLLYDLGTGQWNIPALRSLLEEVLPKNREVRDFQVEHTFPKIGRKKMLLNARRIAASSGEEPMIVLSVEESPG